MKFKARTPGSKECNKCTHLPKLAAALLLYEVQQVRMLGSERNKRLRLPKLNARMPGSKERSRCMPLQPRLTLELIQ